MKREKAEEVMDKFEDAIHDRQGEPMKDGVDSEYYKRRASIIEDLVRTTDNPITESKGSTIMGLGNNVRVHGDAFTIIIKCPGDMRDRSIWIPKKIDENNAHDVISSIDTVLKDVVHSAVRYAQGVLQAKARNLLGFGQ